ncbi:LRR receptor-like serine/threonine-protein kinase ERL1 [Camellia lanceoleosa]|uniref:LRR receptor-like serine/threonine-protein kinase ERL1 n=1 Tax=Camellia lanceoleosa TaxID=1840588 RepID=A0ACC0ISW6_9ERIC|nr:LRR receptor-like serine/threonine-protein kinase ERL1 [Camellia lanceoleosa]
MTLIEEINQKLDEAVPVKYPQQISDFFRVTWQFFNWNPVPRYVPTDWPVVFVSVHFLVMLKIVVCMIFRDISYNQMSGEIPYNIGFLQVATLSLQGNSLTVKIPEVIGLMQALAVLDLSENELVGPIPPILGNLSYIGKLYLHGNKLTGPIPPELGNMSKLSYLPTHGESSTGRIATRDIVQFVPMRDVHGGQISIVQSLLEELPGQFLTYMRSRDIKPHTVNLPQAPFQDHPV